MVRLNFSERTVYDIKRQYEYTTNKLNSSLVSSNSHSFKKQIILELTLAIMYECRILYIWTTIESHVA